jgi:hypothetical protein
MAKKERGSVMRFMDKLKKAVKGNQGDVNVEQHPPVSASKPVQQKKPKTAVAPKGDLRMVYNTTPVSQFLAGVEFAPAGEKGDCHKIDVSEGSMGAALLRTGALSLDRIDTRVKAEATAKPQGARNTDGQNSVIVSEQAMNKALAGNLTVQSMVEHNHVCNSTARAAARPSRSSSFQALHRQYKTIFHRVSSLRSKERGLFSWAGSKYARSGKRRVRRFT